MCTRIKALLRDFEDGLNVGMLGASTPDKGFKLMITAGQNA